MIAVNPYHEEIARLRGRIEELEAEVAYLKEGSADSEELMRAQLRFGLTPTEARVLLAIRDERPKSRDFICNRIEYSGDYWDIALQVYIFKLRAKVGRDAVICHWGIGYSLSAEFSRQLRQVINPPGAAA